jgi:hypothetical protein
MEHILSKLGCVAAALGILLCAVAGGFRLLGYYKIYSFEALTLLQVGIALMVAACVLKLYCPDCTK